MALEDVVLPRRYKDGIILFQQQLDAWRVAAQAGFATVNLNLTQVAKDCFLTGYAYDNDGNANTPASLQEQINLLSSGGTPISGTSSDTFTINTDGFSATLSTFGLTDFRTYTFSDVSGVILTGASCPPVGSIIAHYDFNGLVTFDPNFWTYCNGAVIVNPLSSLNGQTLPDLSNRYLVGFGTEGGADIGTVLFATLAVGNASHQINLEHLHAVDAHVHTLSAHTHTTAAHSHTLSAHTHSVPAHFHGKGTIAIGDSGSHAHTVPSSTGSAGPGAFADEGGGGGAITGIVTVAATHSHLNADFSGSVGNTGSGIDGDAAMVSGSPSVDSTNSVSSGATSGPSVADTGSTSPGTNNQLSTTQSIQPRSIRVRFIMRLR